MLAMLLFATIALQLDVGCIDCVEAEVVGEETSLAADVEEFIEKARASESSWKPESGKAEFPSWALPVFGAAMLVVLFLIAGKGLLRKIFIVPKEKKIHGRKTGHYSKNDYRDAWGPKRAHRENPKGLRGKA